MRIYIYIALLSTPGCSEATREMPASARMFYFDALLIGGQGKVFVYEPVSDPRHPVEFWHKRFSGDFRGNHIYSRLFSLDGLLLQSMTESVDPKGAMLTKLELHYNDPGAGDTAVQAIPIIADSSVEFKSHSVDAKINRATTFLFGPADSTVAANYQIEYIEPGPDSVRVILTRLRRFVGEQEYLYQGETYPALKYEVKDALETETEGFTLSEWVTTEVYALGLGMVYYRKPVNEEFVLEYRLRDIMDYSEFFNSK